MNKDIKIIVIGGSAGSYSVVRNILSSLPKNFPYPIVLCLHRLRDAKAGLCESLNMISSREVIEPEDKSRILSNKVYLAPSNYHLIFETTSSFVLSVDEEVNFSRPSIDLTFDSTARIFTKSALCILLSGANSDGAEGLMLCKERGAYTIIQDPRNALFAKMPEYALKRFSPDKIASETELVNLFNEISNKETKQHKYSYEPGQGFYNNSSYSKGL